MTVSEPAGQAREPRSTVLTLGPVTVDTLRRVATTPEGEHSLSQLEVDLLGFLAAREGRDVSREELLRQVWGHARVGETRAVDMAVMRLRKKLEPYGRIILATRGGGYRIAPPEDRPADPPPVPARRLTNLSRASGSIFGREALLRLLSGELVEGERLLCLEGPPAVGKTRLARELALWELGGGRWGGGVFLVELAEARDLHGIGLGVAEAMDLDTGGQPDAAAAIDAIGRALAARGPVLLVLDRAEHLRDAVAAALKVWRRRSPELAVVITTQARLQLGDERIVMVPALDAEGAVALFRDRASRAGAPPPTAEEEPVLREIVRTLDGIPLSIELVAARARGLTAWELLDRLNPGLVSVGPGGLTFGLREALSWSWGLLGESEQRALSALTVFGGDFSRDAARAVIGEDADLLLEALLDRSLLLRRDEGARRVARFSLLGALRRFAARRMDAAQGEAARRRHAEFFVALSRRMLEERGRVGARAAVDALAAEASSLRDAAGWLSRRSEPEGAWIWIALSEVHAVHGALDLRLDALTRAVQAARGSAPILAEALRSRSLARGQEGREDLALADLEEALAALDGLPPSPARAWVLARRADLERAQGRIAERAIWLERAAEEAEAVGEQRLALAMRAAWSSVRPVAEQNMELAPHALATQRDAYHRLRGDGELALAWTALGSLLSSLDTSGDYAEGLRLRREAQADAARHRLPEMDSYWAMQLGIGLLRAHEFDQAADQLAAVLAAAPPGVVRSRELYARTYLCTALLHLRRYDEARAQILRVQEHGAQPGQLAWANLARGSLVHIALDEGRPDLALALLSASDPQEGNAEEVHRRFAFFLSMAQGMVGDWEACDLTHSASTAPVISAELRLSTWTWGLAAALARGDGPAIAERRARIQQMLARVTLPDQARWRELLADLEHRDPTQAAPIADGAPLPDGRASSTYLRLAARAVVALSAPTPPPPPPSLRHG